MAFLFKAKHLMTEYAKTAHAVEMIIIVVLGLLPSAIIVGTSGYPFESFLPSDLTMFPAAGVYFLYLPITNCDSCYHWSHNVIYSILDFASSKLLSLHVDTYDS